MQRRANRPNTRLRFISSRYLFALLLSSPRVHRGQLYPVGGRRHDRPCPLPLPLYAPPAPLCLQACWLPCDALLRIHENHTPTELRKLPTISLPSATSACLSDGRSRSKVTARMGGCKAVRNRCPKHNRSGRMARDGWQSSATGADKNHEECLRLYRVPFRLEPSCLPMRNSYFQGPHNRALTVQLPIKGSRNPPELPRSRPVQSSLALSPHPMETPWN